MTNQSPAPLTAVFAEKSVYGTIKLYPMNDAAKSICTLLGTKTFKDSPANLKAINDLGVFTQVDLLPTWNVA